MALSKEYCGGFMKYIKHTSMYVITDVNSPVEDKLRVLNPVRHRVSPKKPPHTPLILTVVHAPG